MDDSGETLISHLEALRAMLIKCLTAIGLVLLPMFFVAPLVMETLITWMLGKHDIALNYFSPMEVFILQIKMAVVLDLLVCFPYLARQIWLFVLPALYDNERKFIKSVVLSSSCLFVIGVLFCLFFILPLIIDFGLSFSSQKVQAVIGIGNMMSIALWLSVVFGLMFQFPLVTYALIRSKIASYESVKNKRPYVFVGILILSGLLTPPDIVSQLMLTIPTYLLFETGLFLSRRGKK